MSYSERSRQNNGYQSRDRYPRNNDSGNFQKRRGGFNSSRGNRTYSPRPYDKDRQSNLQLWMGDLEPSWDEDAIVKIWNGLGEAPLAVKLIRDRNSPDGNGKPLYCFVNFANEASVASAFLKNGQNVPNSSKKLKLNYASGNSNSKDEKFNKRPQDDFSLIISGLDDEVKDNQIFDLFNSKYPNSIRQVRIMIDNTTGGSKGFGFVKFNSSATQQIALKEMNGAMLNGKPISIGTSVSSASARNNEAINTLAFDTSSIQLPQQQPKLTKFTNRHNTTIEIKGLAKRLSEIEIENHFIAFGDIVSITMSRDKDNCKIRYRFREDSEAAILAMNHFRVSGTELLVNWGESTVKRIPQQFGSTSTSLRFDKLSTQDIKQWKSQIHEMSEPLPRSGLQTTSISYISKESSISSLI